MNKLNLILNYKMKIKIKKNFLLIEKNIKLYSNNIKLIMK